MSHPADLESTHIAASAETGPVNGDMNEKVYYCLGFAFGWVETGVSGRAPAVALIHKNRPEWQAGKMNGIGGHVEESDPLVVDAMVREFREETGITTYTKEWIPFASMEGRGWHVECYYTHAVNLHSLHTMTDEKIEIVSVDSVTSGLVPIVDHVAWLIPLARDKTARKFIIHA